jgi:ketosteroid isomerase-like protein
MFGAGVGELTVTTAALAPSVPKQICGDTAMTSRSISQRLLALAAAGLFGATLAAAQDGDLQTRIEEVQQRYEEAWTGGDVEALVELHTEDAVVWPASGGVHEGRDAIRRYFEEAPRPASMDIRSERAERVGDVIVDVGTFTGRLGADAGGGPLEGEYLVIARESDGEVRLERLFAAPRRQPPPDQR